MDTERYLAEVIDQLSAASTQDACLRIVARAACDLAEAYGVCLLSEDGDDSFIALPSREPLYICDLRSSGLHREAKSLRQAEDFSARMLWAKEDFITLPTGQRRHIRLALIVPMRTTSHLAVGFFWQPGQMAAPHRARWLELLGRALDLAARSWQRDEEHAAAQRDQLRISAELQHRLRNNLALIRSIIRRSHETAESGEHFALHLEARIGAITRIQAALVIAGAAGVDLEDLIRAELIASVVPEPRTVVQGPAVRLRDKGAELLALTIHELATNSLKFGALATPSGSLAIRWSVTNGAVPCLQLRWTERGASIASPAPRRRGFGQELIECTLPYELGAQTRFDFDPGVVKCELRITLDACGATAVPEAESAVRGVSS